MGINDKGFAILEWFFDSFPRTDSVLELGSQNFYHVYHSAPYGCYADKYYKLKGVKKYDCIDLNGENGAKVLDLSKPIHSLGSYDLVTDFGTQEHISSTMDVEALYNCWTTKYSSSLRHIISVNPKTGNWPLHGKYYFTTAFYDVLAKLTNMRVLKLEEHYAMGNYTDGWEVACVLEKDPSSHWITLDEFQEAFAQLKSQ